MRLSMALEVFRCGICGSKKDMQFVYRASSTQLNRKIYVCMACGTCQSWPKGSSSDEPSLSWGAAWGNLRIGKGLRLEAHLEFLKRCGVRLSRIKKVLDVGAGRGNFFYAFRKENENTQYWAIEPDESLLGWSKGPVFTDENFLCYQDKVENIRMPKNYFGLIYCVHTLEHLRHPLHVLRTLHGALRKDGLMLIEVPNLSIILVDDYFEEFFIDKHNYHWDVNSFVSLIDHVGFEIERGSVSSFNLTFLLRKKREVVHGMPNGLKYMINEYRRLKHHRFERLESVAKDINRMSKHNTIALWGCGRILGGLVSAGLDLNDKILIDNNITSFEGRGVYVPEAQVLNDADLIVICSREHAQEIQDQAEKLCETDIIGWEDLW